MINVAAVGKLPGHLHEWVYNLSRGFRDYTTIAEADDKDKAVDSLPADVNKGNKGKAAESPSRVKDDSKNVDTSNKGKAVAVPSHGKDDDSKDVGKGDKDKAVVPTNPFETKWNSNIDTADKKSKVMKPVPLFPAHHHPASGDAPDKDQPAIAPKKA